jgi:threonine aldolase
VQVIDLRSDFLSRPTLEMRRAMERAAIEPAQFGLREDPRQIALEKRVAELLGMEDAVLLPTCTMANEIALMLLAQPGELVVTQQEAHVLTSEAGAPAALGGLSVLAIPDYRPQIAAWDVMARQPPDELKQRVALFVLENTHNRSGGAVLSPTYTQEVCSVAHKNGVRVHIDGARLFNSAVSQSCEPAALVEGCDTIAISLNKGLGAPLGAALAGSHSLIKRALVLRQRLGGGIRPTGILAAAALVALENWSHLAEDHRRARRLAERLAQAPGLIVSESGVSTNIVVVTIGSSSPSPAAFCAMLGERGVLALPFGPMCIRLVIYRDIDDAAIERAADIILTCL